MFVHCEKWSGSRLLVIHVTYYLDLLLFATRALENGAWRNVTGVLLGVLE